MSPPIEVDAELLAAAEAVRPHAHAPYSRFAVGAALRTKSGRIFSGVNVENASYPVGTCAETGAIAAMVAAGDRAIASLLVVGEGPDPVVPCGACRQRIAEFGSIDTVVYAVAARGDHRTFTLGALLPAAFAFKKPSSG